MRRVRPPYVIMAFWVLCLVCLGWYVHATDLPDPDYTHGGTVVIDAPAVDLYHHGADLTFRDYPQGAEIHWVGFLVVDTGGATYLVADAEIGLREDGVVVWRKIE